MDYQSYAKSPGPHWPKLNWAPHWEIVLTHAQADARSPGEFGRTWFVNRHVRPDVAFDWRPRVTRDTPGMDEDPIGCHVSAAAQAPRDAALVATDRFAAGYPPESRTGGELYRAGDGRSAHQRDWDYLAEAVQRTYAAAGLSSASPAAERIAALVELHNAHCRQPVYPSRHPVDTLLHSSYCTGVANLLATLAMIDGMPARVINTAVHSMVEIWDGTRWVFIDNTSEERFRELAAPPATRAPQIFPRNFLHMQLEPAAPDGTTLSPAHVYRFAADQPWREPWLNTATRDWRFPHARHGLVRPAQPHTLGVGLYALPAADNVRAIYPEWTEPLLPARPGPGPGAELCLTPRQGWIETLVRLDRGMGVRKSFYVGRLDDGANPVTAARADLHLADWFGGDFVPARGGWHLLLNGRALPWDAPGTVLRPGLLSFPLPVGTLRENSLNTVELYSDKTYRGPCKYVMPDTLPVRAGPDGLGTELPWYAAAGGAVYIAPWEPPEGTGITHGTHSAWSLIRDGG
jgi:hypothetical protein